MSSGVIERPSDSKNRESSPALLWPRYAVAIVVAVVGAVIVSLMPRANPDLPWQIRAGLDMLRTHQLPQHDTYSWTRFGAHWIAPEWIFFVVSAEFYQRFHGAFGLWLENVLLSAGFAVTLGILLIRRSGSTAIGIALLIACLSACAELLNDRPQQISNIGMALLAGILSSKNSSRYRLLPLLFFLWANLHQGVLAGLAIGALVTFGNAAQGILLQSKRDPVRGQVLVRSSLLCGAWLLAGAVATLITPYGVGAFEQALVTVGNPTAMQLVAEWLPLSPAGLNGFWTASLLFLVCAVGIVASRREKSFGIGLAAFCLIVQAYLHLRDLPLATAFAAIATAPHIASTAGNVRSQRWLIAATLTLCAVPTAVLNMGLCRDGYRGGITPLHPSSLMNAIGVDCSEASVFLRKERFPERLRLYNSYEAGSYLIGSAPQLKVFVDGRADLYLGGILEDSYRAVYGTLPDDCLAVLDRYRCDCAVVTAGGEYVSLGTTRDWTLVYAEHLRDKRPLYTRTWIFLRNTPANAGLIARCRRDCPAAVSVDGRH